MKLNSRKEEGKKNNVYFTVTSETFVEMLNLGSILHKNNKEYT